MQTIRPNYYGGRNDVYEARKVIRAHRLGFNLGNVIKYVLRAGKKDPEKRIEDLQKAITYLEFEIEETKTPIDVTCNEDQG